MKHLLYMGSLLLASSLLCADVGIINNQTNLDAVLTLNGAAVIDVYADWCNPCKTMAPIFLECSNDANYKSITFLKMNVNTGLAGTFNVISIPTFLFINKGAVIKRVTGKKTKSQLKIELDSFLEQIN
ncbi:thioredoxin family protein [Candidatus Babeliales bacterium]|nr:thioredoxin family protein [Candidatus Babeliales bacterium]